MSERPGDSGGLTSGDPLGGGGTTDAPRHESGLPGYTPPPPPGAGGPPATAYGHEPTALGGRYVLSGWWPRAGAQIIEVDASHSIALSQPTAVAELIRSAAEVTSAVPSPA